jgi:hypothetical protein
VIGKSIMMENTKIAPMVFTFESNSPLPREMNCF